MKVRVTKWGNSLALRIPKPLALEADIAEGAVVEISLADQKIIVQRTEPREYTLDELLAGITDDNLPEKIDTGPPQGREIW